MTESFVFYKSFHEAIKRLPVEQYGRIMFAINEYALYGRKPKLSDIEESVFTLVKPQLDANKKKREIGKIGGEARASKSQEKQTEANGKQNQAGSKQTQASAKQNQAGSKQTQASAKQNQAEAKQAQANVNANDNENANEKGNANYNAAPSAHFQYQDEQTQAAVTHYQQAVYTEWIQQGLPLSSLSKQSFFNFQQQELRESLAEVMRHSAHTKEVVQAIKNAGEVKRLIDTGQSWQNTPVSFAGFWKNITQYLPGAFTVTAFRRNESRARSAKPERAPPARTWTCPVCHHADNTSTICTRCQYEQNGPDTPEEWLALLTARGRLPAHLQEARA